MKEIIIFVLSACHKSSTFVVRLSVLVLRIADNVIGVAAYQYKSTVNNNEQKEYAKEFLPSAYEEPSDLWSQFLFRGVPPSAVTSPV